LHEIAQNLHRKAGRTPPKPVCETVSRLDADKP
jgi:hypothetical protein